MKKPKKIIKAVILFASLFVIISSTLAVLTDRVDTSASAIAGSFDIDVTSELSGKDFMIPGKGYLIGTSIKNIGNKSADLKIIITLVSDDPSVLNTNPGIIDLYYKADLDDTNKPLDGSVPISKIINSDGTVTYAIEKTVNGNEDFGDDAREIEDGITTDTFVPEIYMYIGDYSSTSATYVTITVDIFAKQHRNTEASWDLITSYQEVENN